MTAQMDWIDAPIQKDCPKARLAIVGGAERVAGGIAFALARRAAERDAAAAPLLLCRRRDDAEAPPPPLRDAAEGPPPSKTYRGHADGPALERVRLKYVASLADVAWILNNCQAWPDGHARPTLLVIDGVAALATTESEGVWDAAALHRLAILAKLADTAAAYLGCGCVLVASGAPPAARVVLQRSFPRMRSIDGDAVPSWFFKEPARLGSGQNHRRNDSLKNQAVG